MIQNSALLGITSAFLSYNSAPNPLSYSACVPGCNYARIFFFKNRASFHFIYRLILIIRLIVLEIIPLIKLNV